MLPQPEPRAMGEHLVVVLNVRRARLYRSYGRLGD
jgi:hypothetical protein